MLLAPSYNCPFAHNDLDGGSITLKAVYTVDIVYTIQTAFTVACMPIYILLGKVRTLLEWADALLSKCWTGVEWMDTP